MVIYSDRMGLAKSVKTDVLLEYDTWGCHKFPVAVHIFQADLTSFGEWESQEEDMTFRRKGLPSEKNRTLKILVLYIPKRMDLPNTNK